MIWGFGGEFGIAREEGREESVRPFVVKGKMIDCVGKEESG